ncbi:putative ribonuclease H-like domain-containing protein [Tanacetum coccineum]
MTKVSMGGEHWLMVDPSWVEAMQEELLQFKLQKVWTLVDLPNGKRAIGTKWVFRNKKDERGIVVRKKAIIGCTWLISKQKGSVVLWFLLLLLG